MGTLARPSTQPGSESQTRREVARSDLVTMRQTLQLREDTYKQGMAAYNNQVRAVADARARSGVGHPRGERDLRRDSEGLVLRNPVSCRSKGEAIPGCGELFFR